MEFADETPIGSATTHHCGPFADQVHRTGW